MSSQFRGIWLATGRRLAHGEMNGCPGSAKRAEWKRQASA